jgi:ArsR family transcriptional regulator
MKKFKNLVENNSLIVSSEILRAVTHPLRLKILEFINLNPTINVNKIYSSLQLEQSITSQHLRTLRDVGLVNAHREGKYIRYTINYNKIVHIITTVENFLDSE